MKILVSEWVLSYRILVCYQKTKPHYVSYDKPEMRKKKKFVAIEREAIVKVDFLLFCALPISPSPFPNYFFYVILIYLVSF